MFNEKNVKYFDLLHKKYFIYFLLKKGNVVYVGQTDNIINRVKIHKKNKNFDNVAYFSTTNEKEVNYLENFYILKYSPYYNCFSTNSKCVNSAYIIKKIREKYNEQEINFKDIIKYINNSNYKDILNKKDCIVTSKKYSNLINDLMNYFEKTN